MPKSLESVYLDILLESAQKLRQKQNLLDELFGESNQGFLDSILDEIFDDLADHLGYPPEDGKTGPRDDAYMAWHAFLDAEIEIEEFKDCLASYLEDIPK